MSITQNDKISQVTNETLVVGICRFTIDVLHSDIFSFKTSLNENIPA